ncbi:MAG TPA: hypothetical protein VIS05_03430 [Ilumatobacter sp.]
MRPTRRSTLATALGWVIVAILVVWLFGVVIGVIRFVLRSLLGLVVVAVLVGAYFALKTPPDD